MTVSASDMTTEPTILTVPGLGGSGPTHWQSLWERGRADIVRAELGMWHRPRRDDWVTKLDQAIARARAPVILVAHSLGCLTVAWWAQVSPRTYGSPVAGALLVAPPDVDRPDAPEEIRDFAPSPRRLLPFPSILVASSDDPWIDVGRARSLGADWGSHFVRIGPVGHINADSGIGQWPDGLALLDRVLHAARDSQRQTRTPGEVRALLAGNAADTAEEHRR